MAACRAPGGAYGPPAKPGLPRTRSESRRLTGSHEREHEPRTKRPHAPPPAVIASTSHFLFAVNARRCQRSDAARSRQAHNPLAPQPHPQTKTPIGLTIALEALHNALPLCCGPLPNRLLEPAPFLERGRWAGAEPQTTLEATALPAPPAQTACYARLHVPTRRSRWDESLTGRRLRLPVAGARETHPLTKATSILADGAVETRRSRWAQSHRLANRTPFPVGNGAT